MSQYKAVLDTLKAQMKTTEAQMYKLQGAIEIVTSLQEEAKKEASASRKKTKAK
tara:strand:+ start:1758 stop:1919 length:162 start_codon:yes stop_codon:yes gene_type:complete